MDAQRERIALVAAAAVALVVLAVILVFGRSVPPELPELAEDPDPAIPGLVAFLRDGEGEQCLHVVPASGGDARELRCGEYWHGPPRWDDDGRLTVPLAPSPGTEEVLVIDPRSGAVIDRRAEPRPGTPAPSHPSTATAEDGTLVTTRNRDGRVGLRLIGPEGEERDLVDLEAPRSYSWWDAQWSPDDRWILVTDSEERLLVVTAADGRVRLLVTDASSPVWSPADVEP